jgi:hypothetical protein
MPRKAAAADGETTSAPAGEPRRSSRIKDLPKAPHVVASKKTPAKPRAKAINLFELCSNLSAFVLGQESV